MKKRTALSMIISCLILSGCWDHSEPERLLFVNGIGVDYQENGMVEIFIQIINLQGLAKSEDGGPQSIRQAEVGRAKGRTVEEAIFNLYHTVDQKLFWGHLSYVILSREAVNKGAVKDMADLINRFREFRYRTYFFITEDPIEEVMLVEPLDNISLAFSRLSDPIENYEQSSLIEPVDLRKLILNIDEPGHQILLPMIRLSKKWSNEEGKKKSLLIEEVAVVSSNTLLDIVPEKYFQGTRAVDMDFVRDNVVLLPKDNQYISIVAYDKKTKIIPFTENGRIRFNIKLKLKARLQVTKFNVKIQELEKDISASIKKEIQTAYEYGQKKNFDLFELSSFAYRMEHQTWKKVQKDGLIPLEKDTIASIDIDVRLQNTGRNTEDVIFGHRENKGHDKRYQTGE